MNRVAKRASKLYNKLASELLSMAMTIQEAINDANYSVERVICIFDVILQYSMLQVALIDNRIVREELEFIRDITNYGDFCNFVSGDTEESTLSWEDIYDADASAVRVFLDSSKDVMNSIAPELIATFVTIDRATKHDYFTNFSKNCLAILVSVAGIDDNLTEKSSDYSNCMLLEVLADIGSRVSGAR